MIVIIIIIIIIIIIFQANQEQSNHESNLNVDVKEFYPRVQTSNSELKNSDTQAFDLEKDNNGGVVAKSQQNETQKSNNKIASTPSQPLKTNVARVSKKELIEGIKSMEQQNINLAAIKLQNTAVNNSDTDWNVIKNGRKVKVVKENSNDAKEKNNNLVENSSSVEVSSKVDEIKQEITTTGYVSQENINKKPLVNGASGKCKKGKNKTKKKKSHLATKQDGFEIIEPEFGNAKVLNDTENEVTAVEVSEEEIAPEESAIVQNEEISAIECAIVEKVVESNVNFIATCAVESKDENVIDISDEEISCKTIVELKMTQKAEEMANIEQTSIEKEVEDEEEVEEVEEPLSEVTFEDISYFSDHKNIADLERDLMENLKMLDDGIDIKSPIINPLYDFPITSAVRKWLQEKQNESFDSLFHVQNFKKLSELYDDCDDESDISDSPVKSDTTDSDYASDIQGRLNGSPTSSNAKIDTKKPSTKCNKKLLVKETFCALM
jgi:hypothetical protein